MSRNLKEGDKRLGNQFWKLRSKHGRDKIFKTPELLWEAACEYFEWVEANPILKEDYVGKDAERVFRNLPRPFTMEALCVYLDVNTVYFNQFEAALKLDINEVDKEFSKVITRIREIIKSQKFEGAAVGIFNSNIIARDLGLRDSKDLNLNAEQPLFKIE